MRTLLLLLPLLAGCPATGPVALNEFLASNQNGLVDDSGGTPDWIELLNKSGSDVSLDGWFVSDDTEDPRRHGLDGLTVPADGLLLLYGSGDTSIGEAHLPFRLRMDGEEVVLSNPDGIVDAIAYDAQEPDVSMARVPDGTGDWVAATPTPGDFNE